MYDWTVMVYLAGQNNLADEMVYALKAMKLVGSQPEAYKVVALYDGGLGPVTFEIPKSKSNFSPKDVTNLHEIGEKVRREETQKTKAQLKKLEQKTEKEKAAARKAAEAAKIPMSSVATLSSKVRNVRLPNGPVGELLKLANGEKSYSNKYGGSAVVTSLALTPHARSFLKDALGNNAIKTAEDYEIATDNVDELTEELNALNLDRRVPITVKTQLVEFVISSIKNHEAKHYMLVLSGHGSGAVGDFLAGNSSFSTISIAELGDALSEVSEKFTTNKSRPFKIDVLGFDSCLMGMAEVAYEVRDFADYLVGSEGFEPSMGWPYDVILEGLKTPAGRELKGLPERIVQAYINYYSSDYSLADMSTHMCAMNLKQIENFAKKTKVLADTLTSALKREKPRVGSGKNVRRNGAPPRKRPIRDAILLAHWEAQGFKLEQHVDLWDFCDCLERHKPSAAILKATRAVKEAIVNNKSRRNSLVLYSDYCGPAFQYACGLSIFFPWANNTDSVGTPEMDHYAASLSFAVKTGWHHFVNEYHSATQRPERPGDGTLFNSTLNRMEGVYTGEPDHRRYGPHDNPRFGPHDNPRFGTHDNPRFGTHDNPRFGTHDNPRFGTHDNPRFGGGGGLAKIESMKNPPTRWQKQRNGGKR